MKMAYVIDEEDYIHKYEHIMLVRTSDTLFPWEERSTRK